MLEADCHIVINAAAAKLALLALRPSLGARFSCRDLRSTVSLKVCVVRVLEGLLELMLPVAPLKSPATEGDAQHSTAEAQCQDKQQATGGIAAKRLHVLHKRIAMEAFHVKYMFCCVHAD